MRSQAEGDAGPGPREHVTGAVNPAGADCQEEEAFRLIHSILGGTMQEVGEGHSKARAGTCANARAEQGGF